PGFSAGMSPRKCAQNRPLRDEIVGEWALSEPTFSSLMGVRTVNQDGLSGSGGLEKSCRPGFPSGPAHASQGPETASGPAPEAIRERSPRCSLAGGRLPSLVSADHYECPSDRQVAIAHSLSSASPNMMLQAASPPSMAVWPMSCHPGSSSPFGEVRT